MSAASRLMTSSIVSELFPSRAGMSSMARIFADDLTVELGHRDIEVGEVVAVEDNALGVAFRVADPEPMPKRFLLSHC
jgi:hypothetical protein